MKISSDSLTSCRACIYRTANLHRQSCSVKHGERTKQQHIISDYLRLPSDNAALVQLWNHSPYIFPTEHRYKKIKSRSQRWRKEIADENFPIIPINIFLYIIFISKPQPDKITRCHGNLHRSVIRGALHDIVLSSLYNPPSGTVQTLALHRPARALNY